MEVLALEHLRDGELGGQPDESLEAELEEPLAVEADLGLGRVEKLEDLRLVGFGVGVDLLARERRAGGVAPGGIADQPGEVADEEDDGVAHVLKVLQLAHEDGVAEMKVGRGRIHAQLDAHGPAGLQRLLETLAQVGLANDLHRALAQVLQLLFYRTESHMARLYERASEVGFAGWLVPHICAPFAGVGF